ncbi:hypothetical protein I7I48_09055 [Histoplasma ohiense]|nr:hypothetical protein I7I48_09055 [Histoplasma ohiense (nom. inval.)]
MHLRIHLIQVAIPVDAQHVVIKVRKGKRKIFSTRIDIFTLRAVLCTAPQSLWLQQFFTTRGCMQIALRSGEGRGKSLNYGDTKTILRRPHDIPQGIIRVVVALFWYNIVNMESSGEVEGAGPQSSL